VWSWWMGTLDNGMWVKRTLVNDAIVRCKLPISDFKPFWRPVGKEPVLKCLDLACDVCLAILRSCTAFTWIIDSSPDVLLFATEM